jgi:hypothetical protein
MNVTHLTATTVACLLAGCVSFASPISLVTLRGPATTPKRRQRIGLAAGGALRGTWASGANSSSGSSGDLDITFGTRNERPWNSYTSLRLGQAQGRNGRFLLDLRDSPDDEDEVTAPASILVLSGFGMERRFGADRRFVWETRVGNVQAHC